MKLNIMRRALIALFFLISIFCKNSFADQGTVNTSATVVAGSKCWFLTNNTIINLGNLIPGSGVDVTGTATLRFKCIGKGIISYSITDDDGLFENQPGIHRLKHTTKDEYIIYTFDYNPKNETIIDPNGRPINIERTLNITATVRHNDYQNAWVGNYYDMVTLTINP